MKIGIITITEGENFGNRLQNYAVQKVLEKENINAETIRNYRDENIYTYLMKEKIKGFLKFILKIKGKEDYNEKRKKSFENFNNEFIKFSKYKISNKNISKKIDKYYDYFVCGSDQIWNSNYKENGFVNFLQFCEKNKRIAFAPSFGTDKINDNYKNLYKKWIMSIPKLSVREEAGKKIIENLTVRKDVEVLIDPTMLLNAQEWDKIARKPEKLKNEKFILNYFLGELSEKRKKEIDKVAKENNCEIINILDKNSPFYCSGPSEFLYLEKHAFLICTDSFHSSVFAILYNRPFIIFNREDDTVSMNSRIETLINKFNLKDRKYNEKEITKENMNYDYTEAYSILKEERKKSMKFLMKSINLKSDK